VIEEPVEEAGFNPWWLLAAPFVLVGGKLAWNSVRNRRTKRSRLGGKALTLGVIRPSPESSDSSRR
jgi:hypothetical protein